MDLAPNGRRQKMARMATGWPATAKWLDMAMQVRAQWRRTSRGRRASNVKFPLLTTRGPVPGPRLSRDRRRLEPRQRPRARPRSRRQKARAGRAHRPAHDVAAPVPHAGMGGGDRPPAAHAADHRLRVPQDLLRLASPTRTAPKWCRARTSSSIIGRSRWRRRRATPTSSLLPLRGAGEDRRRDVAAGPGRSRRRGQRGRRRAGRVLRAAPDDGPGRGRLSRALCRHDQQAGRGCPHRAVLRQGRGDGQDPARRAREPRHDQADEAGRGERGAEFLPARSSASSAASISPNTASSRPRMARSTTSASARCWKTSPPTIDTTLNQMLDAARCRTRRAASSAPASTSRAGHARSGSASGSASTRPAARCARISCRSSTPGPSPVLFQPARDADRAAKEITSVQDVMTGEGQANQPATTTLALIEQGHKVMTAIFKRIHRAFGQELRILRRLNRDYLDEEEYFQLNDQAPHPGPDGQPAAAAAAEDRPRGLSGRGSGRDPRLRPEHGVGHAENGPRTGADAVQRRHAGQPAGDPEAVLEALASATSRRC
jgi:hypothetical protein